MKDTAIATWKSFDRATQLVFAGAAIAFLALFFMTDREYFWIEVLFMLEALVLTVFTRSVSTRFALGMFTQGVAISSMTTLLLYQLVGLFDIHGLISGEVVMATIEEVVKIAPVLLAAWIVKKNRGLSFNISDYLLLAVFAGAGFSMVEKSFWDSVSFPLTYGPHIFGWYFFPDALAVYAGDSIIGYVGHAAATGFIGLGIGIGFYLKRTQNRWWWALPLGTFAWVTCEHILSNAYYIDGTELLTAIGGGRLTPWLFIVVLIIGLQIDKKNVGAFARNPKSAEVIAVLDSTQKELVGKLLKQKRPFVPLVHTYLQYMRLTNLMAWEQIEENRNQPKT